MLKRMKRNPINARARQQQDEHGFSILQLVITLAIIAIVSTFAVVAIGHSRSAMRLSASERELASYLEQARTDSIRRHASAPAAAGNPDLRAKVSIPANGGTTYTVTMDFDKDGVLDAARTISLQSGVTFTGVAQVIPFDWRGRTTGEVSIGMVNERGSTGNINITGSGDITLDTEVFQDDDIPNVTLNNNSVSGDVLSDSSVSNSSNYTGTSNTSTNTSTGTTNTSTGSTNTSTGSTNTSTGTTNTSTGSTNTSTGSTNTSTGSTNTSTGSTNTSTGSTNSNTTNVPCSMVVSPSTIELDEDGGTTVSVILSNSNASNTITASPSNSGQIQVSPTTRTLASSGTASFNVTVKKQAGSVSFSTSPNCGTGSISITIKPKK